MNTIRHTTLKLALSAVLAFPVVAGAADPAPETAPAPAEQITPAPMPAMGMGAGMGMGPGLGMRHGAMGENCRMHKGGLAGPNKGCCMGGSEMTDKRLDMLEKRMDMMQMMLEMMMKQSAGGK